MDEVLQPAWGDDDAQPIGDAAAWHYQNKHDTRLQVSVADCINTGDGVKEVLYAAYRHRDACQYARWRDAELAALDLAREARRASHAADARVVDAVVTAKGLGESGALWVANSSARAGLLLSAGAFSAHAAASTSSLDLSLATAATCAALMPDIWPAGSCDDLLGMGGVVNALLRVASSSTCVGFAALCARRNAAELLAALLESSAPMLREQAETSLLLDVAHIGSMQLLVCSLLSGKPDPRLHETLLELLWRALRRVSPGAALMALATAHPALILLESLRPGLCGKIQSLGPDDLLGGAQGLALELSADGEPYFLCCHFQNDNHTSSHEGRVSHEDAEALVVFTAHALALHRLDDPEPFCELPWEALLEPQLDAGDGGGCHLLLMTEPALTGRLLCSQVDHGVEEIVAVAASHDVKLHFDESCELLRPILRKFWGRDYGSLANVQSVLAAQPISPPQEENEVQLGQMCIATRSSDISDAGYPPDSATVPMPEALALHTNMTVEPLERAHPQKTWLSKQNCAPAHSARGADDDDDDCIFVENVPCSVRDHSFSHVPKDPTTPPTSKGCAKNSKDTDCGNLGERSVVAGAGVEKSALESSLVRTQQVALHGPPVLPLSQPKTRTPQVQHTPQQLKQLLQQAQQHALQQRGEVSKSFDEKTAGNVSPELASNLLRRLFATKTCSKTAVQNMAAALAPTDRLLVSQQTLTGGPCARGYAALPTDTLRSICRMRGLPFGGERSELLKQVTSRAQFPPKATMVAVTTSCGHGFAQSTPRHQLLPSTLAQVPPHHTPNGLRSQPSKKKRRCTSVASVEKAASCSRPPTTRARVGEAASTLPLVDSRKVAHSATGGKQRGGDGEKRGVEREAAGGERKQDDAVRSVLLKASILAREVAEVQRQLRETRSLTTKANVLLDDIVAVNASRLD